ncbi:MAG: flagellar protein FlgN [Nitrospiraceae bacterium]|nr:MAG: flagellar protein FlgN [Nitrospiraceae bacterium]
MTSDRAILNILKEQINTYKTLLDLLNRERVCLIDIDAEKVEEISKEKDTVVMRLRLLEEERMRLMRKFAEDNGEKTGINLEEMGKLTGDDMFPVLRSQLLSLLQSIEEMNKFNNVLVDRSLRHIRTTANFFSSFTAQHISHVTGVLLSKET